MNRQISTSKLKSRWALLIVVNLVFVITFVSLPVTASADNPCDNCSFDYFEYGSGTPIYVESYTSFRV